VNVPLDVQTLRPGSDAELLTRVSRTDGTVTIIYNAPSVAAPVDDELTVCIDSCTPPPSDEKQVTFHISVAP